MAGTTSNNNPLRKLVDAFEELAGTVNLANPHIKTSQLAHACRQFIMSNFNFGIPFTFANVELQNKADIVDKAAEMGETIEALVERDVAQGSAKVNSSPSRNIYRLKRVIDFARVVFEQVLQNEGSDSLIDPITIAYDQVFAPYHGSTIREAVVAVKEFIPSKSSVWKLLNENDDSAREPLERYIAASRVVTQYIEGVFLANKSSAELLRLI